MKENSILKFDKPTRKLNSYIITVVGEYDDMLPNEIKEITVENDRMNDFVLLFLAYMGNRKWKHTWENCKFGKDFKHGPLQVYLGAFTDDCHYPCMNILWNDVISVELAYIDKNSNYYECSLPDVEEIYETEEEFLKELKEKFNDFNENDKRDDLDDGTELVDSYELELVRNILRSTGKWNDRDIDNLFFINRDIGFTSVNARDSYYDNLLKVVKQEYAKSATGVEYGGFKPETFAKVQDAVMKSELPEETKTFVIDICGKYNKNNILSENQKKELKKIIETINILEGTYDSIGPNGWSGIYLQHVIDPEQIDFDDFDENEVIKYEGETYIIHEGD